MTLDTINPYLGDIDKLLSTARDDKGKEYVHPALKNLGSVAIPLIREVIAPASFRNADPEITDILDLDGARRVRAVANKFKYGERSRGLQVLRYFGAGGPKPQNRTAFTIRDRPSAAYDLNTIVFGDSANHGKRVLPVKAAAQYSDAVSVQPYTDCVDTSFHNRAAEDGTLFDAEKKENSSNIFERHVLLPGTLLVQTITFNGRTAPPIALEHLLLAIGLAGAYGGQTSVYGVNVRNHVVGIHAARFERDIASPYVALHRVRERAGDRPALEDVRTALAEAFSDAMPTHVPGESVHRFQMQMIEALESDDTQMRERYAEAQGKIGEFFDHWFAGFGPK